MFTYLMLESFIEIESETTVDKLKSELKRLKETGEVEAVINFQDEFGATLLDRAWSNGNLNAAMELRMYGAKTSWEILYTSQFSQTRDLPAPLDSTELTAPIPELHSSSSHTTDDASVKSKRRDHDEAGESEPSRKKSKQRYQYKPYKFPKVIADRQRRSKEAEYIEELRVVCADPEKKITKTEILFRTLESLKDVFKKKQLPCMDSQSQEIMPPTKNTRQTISKKALIDQRRREIEASYIHEIKHILEQLGKEPADRIKTLEIALELLKDQQKDALALKPLSGSEFQTSAPQAISWQFFPATVATPETIEPDARINSHEGEAFSWAHFSQ